MRQQKKKFGPLPILYSLNGQTQLGTFLSRTVIISASQHAALVNHAVVFRKKINKYNGKIVVLRLCSKSV